MGSAPRFAPDGQFHFLSALPAKDVTGSKARAVGGDDLIADEKLGLCRGKAIEKSADEMPSVDDARKHADPVIGDLALGKASFELAPQAAGEDIGKIIIGDFVRRVIAGMGGVEFRQHSLMMLRMSALGSAAKDRYFRPTAFQSSPSNLGS